MISTRKARKLRAWVTRTIEMQRALDASRLERHKQEAAGMIARLKHQLTPEYRLKLSQSLAQWEAHLDSLKDDGVHALVKGSE